MPPPPPPPSPARAEMAEVSSRLLSEEAGRSGAEVELGALRESHDKEMLAAHHARQLAAR